jgi:hypothetical protein
VGYLQTFAYYTIKFHVNENGFITIIHSTVCDQPHKIFEQLPQGIRTLEQSCLISSLTPLNQDLRQQSAVQLTR